MFKMHGWDQECRTHMHNSLGLLLAKMHKKYSNKIGEGPLFKSDPIANLPTFSSPASNNARNNNSSRPLKRIENCTAWTLLSPTPGTAIFPALGWMRWGEASDIKSFEVHQLKATKNPNIWSLGCSLLAGASGIAWIWPLACLNVSTGLNLGWLQRIELLQVAISKRKRIGNYPVQRHLPTRSYQCAALTGITKQESRACHSCCWHNGLEKLQKNQWKRGRSKCSFQSFIMPAVREGERNSTF